MTNLVKIHKIPNLVKIDAEIDNIREKKICITGDMTCRNKKDGDKFLKSIGSERQENVTKKTNILVRADNLHADGKQQPISYESLKQETAADYNKKYGTDIKTITEANYIELLLAAERRKDPTSED